MRILHIERMFMKFQYMLIIHSSDQSFIWWRDADTIKKTLMGLHPTRTRYEVISNRQYNGNRSAGAKIAAQQALQRLGDREFFPPGEQYLLKEYQE